jgi:hypothetical protein
MATNRIAYAITEARRTPSHGPWRAEKVMGGPVSILSADVGTINNTVQMFKVPAGFTLTGMNFEVPSLAASALTLSIGDTLLATRLLNASTAGVAGGKVDVLPAGVLGYKYPTETDIILTATAAGVTPAAGILQCFLKGFIDSPG